MRSLSELPRQVLIGAVHGYRLLLQPWIGNRCRYEPTCSAYALQCLQNHGALRGSCLSAWRILRCNPLSLGGHDPVPTKPLAGLARMACSCAAENPAESIRNLS